MLERVEPLKGGRDTEIDMIEREMEGGVLVVQSPSFYEHSASRRLGGLIEVEDEVEVRLLPNRRERPRG